MNAIQVYDDGLAMSPEIEAKMRMQDHIGKLVSDLSRLILDLRKLSRWMPEPGVVTTRTTALDSIISWLDGKGAYALAAEALIDLGWLAANFHHDRRATSLRIFDLVNRIAWVQQYRG